MKEQQGSAKSYDFLAGGGEMGLRLRAMDWTNTALGLPESWPQSLRSAVSICLNAQFPIAIYWGTELSLIYNDAWSPIPGEKHRWALGRPGQEVWPDIWQDIGPLFERVQRTGEGVWQQDQLLPMNRHGYIEECYFNFTFSPIRDEYGRVGGIFNAVVETTFRVIDERRGRYLQQLTERTTSARSMEEVCERAAAVLQEAAADVPFCLFYLLDENHRAHLVAHAGMELPQELRPESFKIGEADPLWAPETPGEMRVISDLRLHTDRSVPGTAWPEPIKQVLILPLGGLQSSLGSGLLVTALSPRRALDTVYQTFFERIARQVSTAMNDAQAYLAERRRAEALADLDRAKTTFFSNVSHEFRTPLTLLLGPLQDALERPEEGLRGAALESAHRNALRLLKLVNSVLDFSRIQADRVLASYAPLDLCATTEELASVFRAAIERAGLTYRVTCHALPGPVFVDRDMWEKIVLNLLSNAFKYTFEGEIRLTLGADDDHVVLLVSDTGVGIPSAALAHLFERFYRVPGTQGRTHEGSGIGLSLVKELVGLHGGTIDVKSNPGNGSEFRVRLPLGRAHLPQERISAETPVRSAFINAQAFATESLRWLANETGNTASFVSLGDKALFPDSPASDTPSGTVLVVDDNADMREYVARLLGARFVVLTASDGQAALDLIKTGGRPDLVLSDVMMPRLDGVGLLKAIRGNPETEDLPVIFLSARAGEESKIEGLAVGADDYLVKPFSARELVTRIDTHVRLTRLRREAHQRVQTVLNSITDGLLNLDLNWCYTYVSDQASRMLKVSPEQMLGKCVWNMFPHAKGTKFYEEYHRAIETGQSVHFEEYYPQPLNQWLECHCYPSPEGLSVYFRDITERKEAEQQLQQSQKTLLEADRRKDEFLATLAHELRNPLAPIRTAARILGTQGMTQEQLVSCAQVIQRQAQSMALLLDDLLDISRISSNKFQLKKQLVTVASVIQSAVETARPLIDARGHALSLNLPDKPLSVDADPLRLAQVVTNLLTNAAKYTDSNGRIEIAAVQQGVQVEITVRDNGIGLSATDMDQVFEMFSQVDSALGRAQGGLGIGLALVRGIVELHGGEVHARSAGLGKGSAFLIRLPLATATEMVEVITPAANSEPTRHRILVADDNLDARDTLLMLLELSGHEVRTAGDGREALSICAAWRPELAILDIGMPELNGYEVAERLRRESWGKSIALVALTGWGGEKNIQQANAAGFNRHLTKPVDLDNLEKLIAQLLDERPTH